MGKPSIGEIIATTGEREFKNDIKELTILDSGSKESIYSLLFEEKNEGDVKEDEQ